MTAAPVIALFHAQAPGGGVLCGDAGAAAVVPEARFQQERYRCRRCLAKLTARDQRLVREADRAAAKPRRGYSVRRPRRGRGPVADIAAEVISRHRSARAAVTALRAQPRTEEGYTADFIFDEKAQTRISNYQADTGKGKA